MSKQQSEVAVNVKKKPKKVEENATAAQLAFREYERVSYYLATKGDFNFDKDDEAREAFWADNVKLIDKCMKVRGTAPKGDHIDGLAARTNERYPLKPVKKGKKS